MKVFFPPPGYEPSQTLPRSSAHENLVLSPARQVQDHCVKPDTRHP